jgi:hypothetical protein
VDAVWTPPGWPADVPPPGAPGWERRAVAWLLDLCPPEYRGHAVLARHPLLLVRLAARLVAAQQAGTSSARAALRADLSGYLPSAVVAEGLAVLDAEQRRLEQVGGAVQLVERALRGQVFVPRL